MLQEKQQNWLLCVFVPLTEVQLCAALWLSKRSATFSDPLTFSSCFITTDRRTCGDRSEVWCHIGSRLVLSWANELCVSSDVHRCVRPEDRPVNERRVVGLGPKQFQVCCVITSSTLVTWKLSAFVLSLLQHVCSHSAPPQCFMTASFVIPPVIDSLSCPSLSSLVFIVPKWKHFVFFCQFHQNLL